MVYSTERLVELLSRDMAHDEAVEHDERNLAVTWLVERTPLFVSLQHDR